MAENILKLKKRAVDAGMPRAEAMKADRATLDAFLAGGSEKPVKAAKKKAVKKHAPAPTPTAKKKAPAKKAAEPKKQTRKAPVRENTTNGLGRLNIDKSTIDWTAESDDWNPKKGGPVEKLFRALKSCKGNIDKAYAKVADSPYDFVGKTKRDGTKRTKAEVEAMLRYRLNRTLFEFVKRTGQHASAEASNRAAYGTGTYATVRKVKPARAKATSKPKAAPKTPPKKAAKKSARKSTRK